MSIKSHQTMLNNLFIFLETSLNEYGTPATTEEYVKAGLLIIHVNLLLRISQSY